ncbi:hypothetical protein Y032_0225g2749 [Ancylostoma ceylanicum]|uniref:G-protein coupled receptors family 1 profile domain-containing protein n=1 Tax=Ancylostoma ceylanicum TaxID=53326 RepID=A0A016SH57_9BILA|nr:hypothetical protein Y032_0225g2749 [Ancylostoma ceylanicum]
MLNTFIFLLHILPNVLGLLLNAVLFLLARYRSPHAIKKYSILILNFAICDFFACLTSLFVCQRIMPYGTSLFYLSEGPCQYFGARTCYVSGCIASGIITSTNLAVRCIWTVQTQPPMWEPSRGKLSQGDTEMWSGRVSVAVRAEIPIFFLLCCID